MNKISKYLLFSTALLSSASALAVPVFKVTPATTYVVMAPGSSATLDFTVSNNMNVDLKVTNIKPLSNMSNLNGSITADTCTGTTLTKDNGSSCSVTASIIAANIKTKREGYFDITACIDGGAHCSASIVKAKFTIDPNAAPTPPAEVGDSLDGGLVACLASAGICMPTGNSQNCISKNLIVQANDPSITKIWGGSGTTTNATSFDDGKTNTATIIAADITADKAADYCNNLNEGGYQDWYLPSRNELGCLYNNRVVIGGFASTGYWSSAEGSAVGAWGQGFVDGVQGGASKGVNRRVRCVRAFTP